MHGIITAIQRMSINDGPGIRSTLFLKGCNLRCKWCHNPETWSSKPQIEYLENKCIRCARCVSVCPNGNFRIDGGRLSIDRAHCLLCGRCVDGCPGEALRMLGRRVDVEWVLGQFVKDEPFFKNSGGGITVSGGEPFVQYGFTRELLSACKGHGFDTAVETNLTAAWERVESLIPYVDHWMCDLKTFDEELHRKWTGISNRVVKENIRLLSSRVPVLVRTPVIPGVNDSSDELRRIRDFVASLGREARHEFLEFHSLGYCKFSQLGMDNPMPDSTRPFGKNEFQNLIDKL